MANNLGLDPFPDPVGHFGAPWWPFWVLQAVRRCRRWASAPFAARLVCQPWSQIACKTVSKTDRTFTITNIELNTIYIIIGKIKNKNGSLTRGSKVRISTLLPIKKSYLWIIIIIILLIILSIILRIEYVMETTTTTTRII